MVVALLMQSNKDDLLVIVVYIFGSAANFYIACYGTYNCYGIFKH